MQLMTVAEVAKMLHRAPQFVRDLIKDGRIAAYRFGKTRGPWLVDADSVERLFKTRLKPVVDDMAAFIQREQDAMRRLGWDDSAERPARKKAD